MLHRTHSSFQTGRGKAKVYISQALWGLCRRHGQDCLHRVWSRRSWRQGALASRQFHHKQAHILIEGGASRSRSRCTRSKSTQSSMNSDIAFMISLSTLMLMTPIRGNAGTAAWSCWLPAHTRSLVCAASPSMQVLITYALWGTSARRAAQVQVLRMSESAMRASLSCSQTIVARAPAP